MVGPGPKQFNGQYVSTAQGKITNGLVGDMAYLDGDKQSKMLEYYAGETQGVDLYKQLTSTDAFLPTYENVVNATFKAREIELATRQGNAGMDNSIMQAFEVELVPQSLQYLQLAENVTTSAAPAYQNERTVGQIVQLKRKYRQLVLNNYNLGCTYDLAKGLLDLNVFYSDMIMRERALIEMARFKQTEGVRHTILRSSSFATIRAGYHKDKAHENDLENIQRDESELIGCLNGRSKECYLRMVGALSFAGYSTGHEYMHCYVTPPVKDMLEYSGSDTLKGTMKIQSVEAPIAVNSITIDESAAKHYNAMRTTFFVCEKFNPLTNYLDLQTHSTTKRVDKQGIRLGLMVNASGAIFKSRKHTFGRYIYTNMVMKYVVQGTDSATLVFNQKHAYGIPNTRASIYEPAAYLEPGIVNKGKENEKYDLLKLITDVKSLYAHSSIAADVKLDEAAVKDKVLACNDLACVLELIQKGKPLLIKETDTDMFANVHNLFGLFCLKKTSGEPYFYSANRDDAVQTRLAFKYGFLPKYRESVDTVRMELAHNTMFVECFNRMDGTSKNIEYGQLLAMTFLLQLHSKFESANAVRTTTFKVANHIGEPPSQPDGVNVYRENDSAATKAYQNAFNKVNAGFHVIRG